MKFDIVGTPPELEPGTYSVQVDRISLDGKGDVVAKMHFISPVDQLSKIRQLLTTEGEGTLEGMSMLKASLVIDLATHDQLAQINKNLSQVCQAVRYIKEGASVPPEWLMH